MLHQTPFHRGGGEGRNNVFLEYQNTQLLHFPKETFWFQNDCLEQKSLFHYIKIILQEEESKLIISLKQDSWIGLTVFLFSPDFHFSIGKEENQDFSILLGDRERRTTLKTAMWDPRSNVAQNYLWDCYNFCLLLRICDTAANYSLN